MPRKSQKEQVSGHFFTWLLGQRGGVYYADGRGNRPGLGRHSLGTRHRVEALDRLRHLDLVKAVEVGLADASALDLDRDSLLPLEDGRQRYMDYVKRPPAQGGASPGTVKRYRAVFDKFLTFAAAAGVRVWQQVTKDVLTRYGRWLDDNDYHDKTQYIELTVLKQALKWMVSESLLPPACQVHLKLPKPQGTSTYCYTQNQVHAIIAKCREDGRFDWLADVVVALATTGLRIGELSALRWSDVDLERGVLTLTDTSRRTRKSKRRDARSTKSHRGRVLPLHPELRAVLGRLPRAADGRVFHGPNGGLLKPDTVRIVLTRDVLTPLAEVFPPQGDDPGIAAGRLHSFRHFFCSMSVDSGVPEPMLMAWLGHRESALIRHYYHLSQEESRRHMSKLPSFRVGAVASPAPGQAADHDPTLGGRETGVDC